MSGNSSFGPRKGLRALWRGSRPRRPQGPNGGPPRGPRFRRVRTISAVVLAAGVLGVSAITIVTWSEYGAFQAGLPTVSGLRTYQPPVVSRIYSGDDRLMAELAAERRIFVPVAAIPTQVKDAFIAIEDQHFYSHGGIDPLAIARAALGDVTHSGRRPKGASTITQQVAKVMLLNTNDITIALKIREALLAMRIEQTLTKDQILEIYLNEIYLGERAYGVAAAAETYFGKPLDQLDLAEAAFLAALPRSPTNYDPYHHLDAATDRRNLVLQRMAETGAISAQARDAAMAEPLVPHVQTRSGPVPGSEWFASEVRRELVARYGLDQTMRGGMDVHTSLDPHLQQVATDTLHDGLMAYDRTHGSWRGASGRLSSVSDDEGTSWSQALHDTAPPTGMLDAWRLAVVLDPDLGRVGWLEGGSPKRAPIMLRDLYWTQAGRRLRRGDLVMIEPQADGPRVALRQIPKVEGAIVSMDVRTGRVLAMVGGWSFRDSQFNRATQALRQPGSSFKPFVYLAAMEQGIPPSEKFDDSAVTYGSWHPQNYEHDYWGPTTLHDALRESRNLVTIRLAAHLGMKDVSDMAIKAGLVDQMPHVLPAALGAVETTVLREAGAYASIASGGRQVSPSLIDDVQDRTGQIIWRPAGFGLKTITQTPPPPPGQPADQPPASGTAQASAPAGATPGQPTPVAAPAPNPADMVTVPEIDDQRPRIASEDSAYQIITMMKDVVARGTGTAAATGITQPIAGKTGTSQNFNDAWFAGFSPEVVTVVWVGYDSPQSLGEKETGGRIAGPLWNRVMKAALADRPPVDFRTPADMTLARYDTGRLMAVDAFKPGQTPGSSIALNGFGAGTEALGAADTGAEAISGSEDDMVSGQGQNGASSAPANGATPDTRATPGANPQASAASTSDIGMGGLY
jgi:penicillin-binding protein 1A